MRFFITPDYARRVAACAVTVSITIGALALAGCMERSNPTAPAKKSPGTAETIDVRSKVVGVAPAGPTKETVGTTPIVKSDVTKAEAANAMPMPKQANDHSIPVKPTPQKAKTP